MKIQPICKSSSTHFCVPRATVAPSATGRPTISPDYKAASRRIYFLKHLWRKTRNLIMNEDVLKCMDRAHANLENALNLCLGFNWFRFKKIILMKAGFTIVIFWFIISSALCVDQGIWNIHDNARWEHIGLHTVYTRKWYIFKNCLFSL